MINTVSILLAIYKPNYKFLSELLESLNNQNYKGIKLLVRDDSDDSDEYIKVSDIIKLKIKNFEYMINKNEQNLGSSKTFELLAKETDTKYIAFCDQDDIWEIDKISKLVGLIEMENSDLCYSDLSVIDCDGIVSAISFKQIRKRIKHVYGENQFYYLLRRNSITGCATLIKSDVVKKAIPFPVHLVHDQWLALFVSTFGLISYTKERLVRYRIYSGNQIGANKLTNIFSKETYLKNRLKVERANYLFLLHENYFPQNVNCELKRLLKWTKNRINYFEKKNITNILNFIFGAMRDPILFIFEFFLGSFTENFSIKLINIVRKSKW